MATIFVVVVPAIASKSVDDIDLSIENAMVSEAGGETARVQAAVTVQGIPFDAEAKAMQVMLLFVAAAAVALHILKKPSV